MIDSLGHHLIPLLSSPGAAGALGGKAHLAAVKEACKSAERIHGALTMAGRFEVAVVPAVPDFFDPAPGMAKARNLAWGTIQTSPRLQWVIPTRYPQLIPQSLPPTWIGKGFQNVCIALLADGADGFSEQLQALKNAPVQRRALFLYPSNAPIDLIGQLHGIDWVVFVGTASDIPLAATTERTCREAGVALLFHRIDEAHQPREIHADPNNDCPWPSHPFGTKIDLFQPTLPALKSVTTTPPESAPPAHLENNPKASSPDTMKTTNQPIDSPQESSASTAVTPSEVIKSEFLPAEPSPPASDSALPAVTDADHDDFVRLDAVVRRGLATFIEVGLALAEIRDRELWHAGGHPSWAAYCPIVGGLTKTHANRLINSAEIAIRLAKVTPIGVTPTAESQVRPLSKLKQPEQQALAWSRASEQANGQPTADLVKDAVAEIIGDKPPAAKPKPNRKQKVLDTFMKLRAAVLTKRPQEEIELRLSELEALLKTP